MPNTFGVLAYQVQYPAGSPLVLSPLGLCTHAFDGNSDAPLLFALVGNNGHAAVGLPVPAGPLFIGLEVKLQWAVLDGGDPFTGLTPSPALLLRLGEY